MSNDNTKHDLLINLFEAVRKAGCCLRDQTHDMIYINRLVIKTGTALGLAPNNIMALTDDLDNAQFQSNPKAVSTLTPEQIAYITTGLYVTAFYYSTNFNDDEDYHAAHEEFFSTFIDYLIEYRPLVTYVHLQSLLDSPLEPVYLPDYLPVERES